MRRTTGMATRAEPRVWKVPPSPAQRAEPGTSSATSAPAATPAESPTPPSICGVTRVRTTCRWTGSRVVVEVTPVSIPRRVGPVRSAADARHRPLVVVADAGVLELVEGHLREREAAALLAVDG